MPTKRRRESNSDQPFLYSPLNKDIDSSFRVCTLLPGDENQPVACLLSHDDRKTSTQSYEAISYVWGNTRPSKTITLNGHPFTVGPNLESVLRKLRYRGRAKSRHRRLWIDAICINQSDLAERGQQVQQMYHIYNAAEQVIVWLGTSEFGSDSATNFMIDKLRPSLEAVGFSCKDEQANVESKFWEEWDEGKDAETLEAIDLFINPKNARYWSALAKLLQRPWWSRAWTVQELISARRVVVQVGNQTVPWPLLDMTIQLMLRNTGIENLFTQRDRIPFQSAIEDAHAFAYERSHRILNGPGPEDFTQLMQVTRCRHSQDPRDKAFSILSILDTTSTTYLYQPDYSESVQAAYASVAQAHIRRTESLHILSSCCFLSTQSTPSLPSWVPDWQMSCDISYLGGYSAKDTEFKYNASSSKSAIVSFSPDSRVLTASGVLVDIVTDSHLQESSVEFDYLVTSNKQEPWCTWDIHNIVSRLELCKNVICGAEETVLQAVLKTLIVDRNPASGKRNQQIKLHRSKTHLWPVSLEAYLSHVQMFTQGRTLVWSQRGYIGLAPLATQSGDKICILFGCHAPVILRRIPGPDECCILIGDAYIHGIMDGGAIGAAKQAEEFVIR